MDSLKLFTKAIPELEGLPEKPKVFWYVSAGKDFRGPVFLTQHNIDKRSKHNKRYYERPDLFLYNCIGHEIPELIEILKSDTPVLFFDTTTTVTGKNFKQFGINKNISLEISPDFIEYNHVSEFIPTSDNTALYFEVVVTGKDYTETQKVLYLLHENIDVFRKFILSGYFEVMYLCITFEGCAQGNCKKSIIEHIFKDSNPVELFKNGFTPNYYIFVKGTAQEIFQAAIKKHSSYIQVEEHGTYIEKRIYDPKKDGLCKNETDPLLFKASYKI